MLKQTDQNKFQYNAITTSITNLINDKRFKLRMLKKFGEKVRFVPRRATLAIAGPKPGNDSC
jgi:hypothetical protein